MWKLQQWRQFVVAFACGAAVVVAVSLLLEGLLKSQETATIEQQYRQLVNGTYHAFEGARSGTSYALRIALLPSTQTFAANQTEENAAAVLADVKALGVYLPLAHEFRFVGADGMEKLKLFPAWEPGDDGGIGASNGNLTGYWVANSSELLSVIDTPFFEPSMRLPRGKFRVTGMEREEIDAQPLSERNCTVMYVTSVVLEANTSALPVDWALESETPPPAGFVLVSIHAEALLDSIVAALQADHVPNLGAGVGKTNYHILNNQGYWLSSNTVPEEDLFAWQTPGKENLSFAYMYPDLWREIQERSVVSGQTVQFYSHGGSRKGSLVTVYRGSVCDSVPSSYYPAAPACEESGDADLYVVEEVPHEYVLGPQLQASGVMALVWIFVGILLWAAVAAAAVSSWHLRSEALEKKYDMEQFRTRNKEMFLQTMCHEIRTPLNAVVGAISMLAGDDLPAHKQPLVTILEEAATLMMSVLNDVLDAGKIERGQMHLDPREFAVRSMVESTVEIHAVAALQKHVDVFLEVGDDVPDVVIADDLRIRQCCTNLLSNAVKFTEKGSITMTVSLIQQQPAEGETPRAPEGLLRRIRSQASQRATRGSTAAVAAALPSPPDTSAHLPVTLSVHERDCRRSSRSGSGVGLRALDLEEGLVAAPALPVNGEAKSLGESSSASKRAVASEGATQQTPSLRAAAAAAAAVPSAGSGCGTGAVLRIAVADTGKGIAEEGQTRIFDAFEQEEVGTTRRYGGTGLGLCIVKKLAEAMGGGVTVSSTVGRGSTFTVDLPVTVPSLEDAEAFTLENRVPFPRTASSNNLASCLFVAATPGPASHGSAITQATLRSPVQRLLLAPEQQPALHGAKAAEKAVRDAWTSAATAAAERQKSSPGVGGWSGWAAGKGSIPVVVVDVSGFSANAPEALAELRRLPIATGKVPGAAIVLLDGAWAHLINSTLLKGYCHVITMPITAGKLEQVLARILSQPLTAHSSRNSSQQHLDGTGATGSDSGSNASPDASGIDVGPMAVASWRVGGCVVSANGAAGMGQRTASWEAPLALGGPPRDARMASAPCASAQGRGLRQSQRCERAPAWELPPPLPAALIALQQQQQSSSEDNGGRMRGVAALPAQLRVLVVDDQDTNRRILEHMLLKLGHVCVTAASGEEAVSADLKQNPPFHLVLMDLQMPGPLDGADATARLLSSHRPADQRKASRSPRIQQLLPLTPRQRQHTRREQALTPTAALGSHCQWSNGHATSGWARSGNSRSGGGQDVPASAAHEAQVGAASLRSCRPPVVAVLTASALDSDRERCMKAGAASFLTKPLPWQRLKTFLSDELPQLYQNALPDDAPSSGNGIQ